MSKETFNDALKEIDNKKDRQELLKDKPETAEERKRWMRKMEWLKRRV